MIGVQVLRNWGHGTQLLICVTSATTTSRGPLLRIRPVLGNSVPVCGVVPEKCLVLLLRTSEWFQRRKHVFLSVTLAPIEPAESARIMTYTSEDQNLVKYLCPDYSRADMLGNVVPLILACQLET
jgi:hypothetical protein